MKRWIERGLNIEPGDLRRGIPLCACLFLIMSCYVTGRVARDALFLARFQAVQLPYADIASAIVTVGLLVYLVYALIRCSDLVTEHRWPLTDPSVLAVFGVCGGIDRSDRVSAVCAGVVGAGLGGGVHAD